MTTATADRPLRIAFVSGPANAPKIWREWSERSDQDYFGTDYLKQYLQLATDLGAVSHVVTWYGDTPGVERRGDFTFDNRPITTASGVRYLLSHIWWHLRLLPILLRFRPDILMLTGNQNFWWLLAPVRWQGAKIVISYHAVLWAQFGAVSRTWRTLLELNRRLILRHARAILETSHAIRRQIEELLGPDRDRVPVLEHLPSYQRRQFAGIASPETAPRPPFRVFFLGRNEANKGIFDIVEIGRRLEHEWPGHYRFDLCGSGGALEGLRARVRELGLTSVHVHGFVGAERVEELLGAAHACIVPTRSDYEAGFEMTCSESILAGRPLITSRVCPAIEYMREATLEVEPDDVEGYQDAIVRLRDNQALYERLRAACAPLQAQFYDPDNSWLAVMRRAIDRHVLTPAKP